MSLQSERTTVSRHSERGSFDREVVYSILDEALICHIGFVDDGHPFVIPTIHVRVGDRLCIHGSTGSRMIRCLAAGGPACVTATLLDGLVLARSAFHHSMNYRSVVVLARGEEVRDAEEKLKILDALVEHVAPGRLADVRRPSEQEMNATGVISFPISEASAKIRTGPPVDREEDHELSAWAGVIPMQLVAGDPIADPQLAPGISCPDYVTQYTRAAR